MESVLEVIPPAITTAGTALGAFALTVLLVCGFTYISTTLAFYINLQHKSSATKAATPPLVPYFVPFIGSTIQFSNQTVGAYWTWLQAQSAKYGRDAFSIVLSGIRTNLIFSEDGIAAVFRSRQVSRAKLDQQIGVNVLGMSKVDAARAFPYDVEQKEQTSIARIHTEHLLSATAVNELTTKFMELFTAELQQQKDLDQGVEVDLYSWLWHIIFRATSTAQSGPRLLQMYPDFDKDYRIWEDNLLALLFGIPRFVAPEAYRARDACLAKLEKWLEEGYRLSPPAGADKDPDWEPVFGSRVCRKRHEYYQQQRLTLHGQAGYDLIALAGIVSNATPATGWLLLHILSPTSPPDFLPAVMAELRSCVRADGTVDVPALTRLPLLNSAFNETLRLYVDLLVVRQVDSSTTLGHHAVRAGEQVMAPTWMTHRNPSFFPDPDRFVPDRFLQLKQKPDELRGRFFPFGGGHYQCPGRVFARQEVLATVATLLLGFEIEFVRFSGGQGGFPRIKKGYVGNQVVGIEGDMRVRIRRRRSSDR